MPAAAVASSLAFEFHVMQLRSVLARTYAELMDHCFARRAWGSARVQQSFYQRRISRTRRCRGVRGTVGERARVTATRRGHRARARTRASASASACACACACARKERIAARVIELRCELPLLESCIWECWRARSLSTGDKLVHQRSGCLLPRVL